MNFLNHLLDNSKEFICVTDCVQNKQFPINISGTADAQKAHLISSICEKTGKKPFVVTQNELHAKRIYDDLSFFWEYECVYIPKKDVVVYKVDAADHELENDRAAALGRLSEGAAAVTSIESLLHFVMPKNNLNDMKLTFEYGKTTDSTLLCEKLAQMGYSRVDSVNLRGQFAVRGGIIDIFSPDSQNPIRMELFGDEIDSLRSFDCETQLSIDKIKSVTILPVSAQDERSSMLTYLDDTYIIFVDEPLKVSESAKATLWEINENVKTLAEKGEADLDKVYLNDYNSLINEISGRNCIGLSSIGNACPDYKSNKEFTVNSKGMSSYSGNIDFLINDLHQWMQ